MGDEESGYDIALRGIRAGLAAHEGSEPEAEISRTLLAELGMKGWVEIVARVYGGYLGRSALASLAPCIMRCAERLANKSFPFHGVQVVDRKEILSYCGGILTGAPLLRSFVEESLRSEGLGMRLLPAVLGAVVLARERAGSILDEFVLVKLELLASSLLSEA